MGGGKQQLPTNRGASKPMGLSPSQNRKYE